MKLPGGAASGTGAGGAVLGRVGDDAVIRVAAADARILKLLPTRKRDAFLDILGDMSHAAELFAEAAEAEGGAKAKKKAKDKAEKAAKAPKASKAEKPAKAAKVAKPVKAVKPAKAAKPEPVNGAAKIAKPAKAVAKAKPAPKPKKTKKAAATVDA